MTAMNIIRPMMPPMSTNASPMIIPIIASTVYSKENKNPCKKYLTIIQRFDSSSSFSILSPLFEKLTNRS